LECDVRFGCLCIVLLLIVYFCETCCLSGYLCLTVNFKAAGGDCELKISRLLDAFPLGSITLNIFGRVLVKFIRPVGEVTCLMYGGISDGVKVVTRLIVGFLYIFFLIEFVEMYLLKSVRFSNYFASFIVIHSMAILSERLDNYNYND
jgi:hypothetical protein